MYKVLRLRKAVPCIPYFTKRDVCLRAWPALYAYQPEHGQKANKRKNQQQPLTRKRHAHLHGTCMPRTRTRTESTCQLFASTIRMRSLVHCTVALVLRWRWQASLQLRVPGVGQLAVVGEAAVGGVVSTTRLPGWLVQNNKKTVKLCLRLITSRRQFIGSPSAGGRRRHFE